MEGWETHIQLLRIPLSDDLALVAELIEEEKPSNAVLPDEIGETDEGEAGDGAEGELGDGVVGAVVEGVAVCAGEHEMGEAGDDNGEDDEDEPGEAGGPGVGLVDAEPFQP